MSIKIDESTQSSNGNVSVIVTAEPLTLDIPADVESAPADAIADGIRTAIRSITQLAAGGRHRAFNNTGTLANEITAILGASGYDIVAPPGYLQDDAVLQRLLELVPAIEDPSTLQQLADAVERVTAAMLVVG